MGSVQSDIVCKKCKFPYAMEDYYYKSGEVWVFCDRCGYSYEGFYKRRNDGNFFVDKDGKWIPIEKKGGGFGTYHHLNKRGGGVGGHFVNKWTAKKVIRNMIKGIKAPKRQGEIIFYTKKINGKWFMFDARTGINAEIPNNIDYEVWMDMKNGKLRSKNERQ